MFKLGRSPGPRAGGRPSATYCTKSVSQVIEIHGSCAALALRGFAQVSWFVLMHARSRRASNPLPVAAPPSTSPLRTEERARVLGSAPFAAALVVALAAVAGCGGDPSKSGVANAKLPSGSRSAPVEHEACEERGSRAEEIDANNDGRPDIRRIYGKDGREVCRTTDLNRDGKPDMYEYYGADGKIRRREASYDDSGVVNAIEFFEGGRLVRRELDTTGRRTIDTWDFFDPNSGRRLKRERDSRGDGKVDQWWTWEDGGKVTIMIDKNGDGKADPESTVVMGPGGTSAYTPPGPTGTEPQPMGGEPPGAFVADAGAAPVGQAPPSAESQPLPQAATADGGAAAPARSGGR